MLTVGKVASAAAGIAPIINQLATILPHPFKGDLMSHHNYLANIIALSRLASNQQLTYEKAYALVNSMPRLPEAIKHVSDYLILEANAAAKRGGNSDRFNRALKEFNTLCAIRIETQVNNAPAALTKLDWRMQAKWQLLKSTVITRAQKISSLRIAGSPEAGVLAASTLNVVLGSMAIVGFAVTKFQFIYPQTAVTWWFGSWRLMLSALKFYAQAY